MATTIFACKVASSVSAQGGSKCIVHSTSAADQTAVYTLKPPNETFRLEKNSTLNPQGSSVSLVTATTPSHLQQELADEQNGVPPNQGVRVLKTSSHGGHVSVYHRRVPGGRIARVVWKKPMDASRNKRVLQVFGVVDGLSSFCAEKKI